MKKQFINLQFAFFINHSFIENKSDFVLKLKKIYDGNELILNIGPEIPNDFPYIFLSKENDFEIKIAKNRVDLFLLNEDGFKNKVKSLYNFFLKDDYFFIKDIGCVFRYNIGLKDGSNVNDKIQSIFNSSQSFVDKNQSSEIIIRNLIKGEIKIGSENIKINLIKLLSSNVSDSGIVFVEFDINTKPNESKKIWITENNLDDFLKEYMNKKNEFFTSLENILK